jgi:hypothetical protein
VTAIAPELRLDERLDALIRSDPAAVGEPFGLYQDLLAHAPVYEWGPTVVVSGYDAVRSIPPRDSAELSNRAYSVGSRDDSPATKSR